MSDVISNFTDAKGKQDFEYYIGLDIGTTSVGFAATNVNYVIQRKKGKHILGFRLFDSGKTAVERRTSRSNRRRLQRRKQRTQLLQEFFDAEICKADQGFFQRLRQSFFRTEHKNECQSNTLFNDKDYTDKDYHFEFPTVYHLRDALYANQDRKFDIRLLYLAIAHILKKRGHFLFEGQSIVTKDTQDTENNSSFNDIFLQFSEAIYSLVDRADENADQIDFADMLNLNGKTASQVEEILANRTTKTDKKKQLYTLFNTKDKQAKAFLDLLAGSSVKPYNLFLKEELKENAKEICFANADFEEKADERIETLGENVHCINMAKAAYDWALLVTILGENDTISKAKIKSFDKHKKDLRILKDFMKKHCSKQAYSQMFNDDTLKDNYIAYIGNSKASNNKSVCDAKTFYDYVKKILKKAPTDANNYEYILTEIEKNAFMPKQSTSDNGVIPYQLHLKELKQILANAENHHSFLLEKCPESGLTVSEKILSLMTFRIPYYVGPLNTAHQQEGIRSNCWAVRKEQGKIYPWNIEKKIDLDETAEKFIKQMTNKCTYLVGADVLPKNSLLNSKFTVLNEINNIRIDGEKISVQLKQDIYNELFLKYPKVTRKRIKDYLKANGKLGKDADIEGVDEDFKSSMKPLLDLQAILGDKADNYGLCEKIILALTLFGEEKNLIKQRLQNKYENQLSQNEINKLANLKYKGWGRLSKEFLTSIEGASSETGECHSIINCLYSTNDNLMQLLSYRYTYLDEINKYNVAQQDQPLTKENFKEYVQELYCSPAVKRGINQAIKVVLEIEEVMGKAPSKIFIEMAREDGEKKRSVSRKNTLLALYKRCKDNSEEVKELIESLEEKTDADLRSKTLYLYYTQMGKCMYSGEKIFLSELFSRNIYDIDHIYPQSKTKDDSFNNLVLVKNIIISILKKIYIQFQKPCEMIQQRHIGYA